MIRNSILFIPFLIWLLSGCGTTKETTTQPEEIIIDSVKVEDYDYVEEDIFEEKDTTPKFFQSSPTRYFDLLHTKLEVTPDWEKEQLKGKAYLTIKPYFYPDSILVLDAKHFDINRIALVEKGKMKNVLYTYDSMQIHINLGKVYTRKDTFQIFVDYLAKPNELPNKSALGRNPNQGLYFINADRSDPKKPSQLWTQGETEFSSAWFPTIDKPNERTTQELAITVADTLTTLSNGVLSSVKQNNDRTKTWTWRLDQPHAPYLFMIAAGNFKVTKDKWKDIELGYYLEPKYSSYAKDIFGNTPEILNFFSDLTGVKYPWPVYNQIVVQDFVTGAMENTTASVYSAPIQKTRRELLDGDHEDVIVHEAVHQWFGNLVTTESWANIVLNEAFATYGEYLWFEHKYGRDRADHHLQNDLNMYMMETQSKQNPLIRYHYQAKEEVFDAHSYQKGSWVLHMLRKTVGDEAFNRSLNVYLTKNKYQPVEIHDLRKAFEEVTGRDLMWFFDQWFLEPGHPILNIEKGIDIENNRSFIKVVQANSMGKDLVYRLPVAIDIYKNGKPVRKEVVIDQSEQTFYFDGIAEHIVFDAENSLLAEVEEEKTTAELIYQYNNAPLYVNRMEAITALASEQEDPEVQELLRKAINDPYWHIRKSAIDKITFIGEDGGLASKLMDIALRDKDSRVRAAALIQLYSTMDSTYMDVMRTALEDSSYYVQGEALYGTFLLAPNEAVKIAKDYENVENVNIALSIADIYSNLGGPEAHDFFIKKISATDSWDKYTMITYYGIYLQRIDDLDEVMKGFNALKNVAINDPDWLFRFNSKSMMDRLLEDYYLELSELRINEPDSERRHEIEELLNSVQAMFKEIISQEDNETLLNIYEAKD